MRNLELKARYTDLQRGEQIARAMDAQFGGELHQTDTYFYVPNGRLKLREVRQADPHTNETITRSELIFYQRPEADATRWSDYYTCEVSEATKMLNVLTRSLGVRQVVQKTRRLYLYQGARIHLDAVAQLGHFIEFEVPTVEGAEERARQLMRQLMQAFVLVESEAIHSSYGEMLGVEN